MVKGLELFRAHFASFTDRYVLIGGTACDIAMTDANVPFRATKDLDIVLVVEALDSPFVAAFWEFVRAGKYQAQEKSTGERQFYRFHKPENAEYPHMLELFSRAPDVLQPATDSHLTPLPMEEEVSSLSAILMDDEYYAFVLSGRRQTEDGLSCLDAEHLIPLKVRAWLDLTAREVRAEKIDGKDIRKHKNDVFRLYQIITALADPPPAQVQADISEFIARVRGEGVDLKALKVRGTLDEILAGLERAYHLVSELAPA